MYYTTLNIYRDLIFSIHRMKVRWHMLTRKNTNNNS